MRNLTDDYSTHPHSRSLTRLLNIFAINRYLT